MTSTGIGPQPVFLFSLARSGSTLLQRLLAAHDDIASASEPWLLLPLLYTIRSKGHYTEYGQGLASTALEDFFRELPNGRDDYLDEIRTIALNLYRKAAGDDTRYFLDKTPRYNLIADEIVSMFSSEAKYIFLWRNPLSVAASMIESFSAGRWHLYRYKIHLYTGLENLLKTHDTQRARFCSVRFEDLVADPQSELSKIADYLDVRDDFSTLESLEESGLVGRLGDRWGSAKYHKVSIEPTDKWKRTLANPIRKAWCRKYLHWLGAERLSYMGYNLNDLLAEVDAIPSTLQGVGSDIIQSGYGVAYSVLEPYIFREKIKDLHEWRNVRPLH